MRLLLCLLRGFRWLVVGNTLAETAPQELLTAKKVYLRERRSDRKLLRQIRQEVKQWGRWELVTAPRMRTWCWC